LTPLDQGILFLFAGTLGFIVSWVDSSGRFAGAVGFVNIWVALPGLFFIIYLTRGILSEDAGIAAFSVVFIVVMLGFLMAASRGMAPEVRGAVMLNGAFVNSVNLPFPILQATMGTYSYAATFAVILNAAQILAARALQRRLRTGSVGGLRESLSRAAPLAALGVGVLLHYIAWPAVPSQEVAASADLFENLLIAAIFVSFGASLYHSISKQGNALGFGSRPFRVTALSRVAVGPLLALLLASPLGIGSSVYIQMVFVAAMPPAVINTLLARVYGFDEESTARWTAFLTPLNTVEGILLLYLLGGFR
jgi:predicted permease